MSEAHRESERIELETVVNWRMIAVGGAVATVALVALVVFLLLSGPRTAPEKEQAFAPPPAAPVPERSPLAPPRKSPPAPQKSAPAAPPRVALPERLPAPVETPILPPPPAPARVAAVHPPAVPREAVAKAEAPAPTKPAFRRIRPYSEAEELYLLERQAKEVDLDATKGPAKKILEAAAKGPAPEPKGRDKDAAYPLPEAQPVLDLIAKRDDLKGLPVRMGDDCVSGGKAVETTAKISRDLRRARASSETSRGSFGASMRHDQELVSFLSKRRDWCDEAGVPVLLQMLQAENGPVRLQLVEMLDRVKGEKAGAALAQRAVFDTSPDVRQAAVKALQGRPRAEARPVLFDGLRYPWAPAAEHAAEALAALHDHESVFALAGLLDEPDPTAPVRDKEGKWVVTEVVRVNHLGNCLLCHAPSFNRKEPIRGVVPEKGKEIPELYYDSDVGTFVRADVVYLKQDFSVLQPVSGADPWPAMQRFDYLTRKREATKDEIKRLSSAKEDKAPPAYLQRSAVLWALRELTGEDVGDRSEDWYRALAALYFGIDL